MLPSFSIALLFFVPSVIARLLGMNVQGTEYAYLPALFNLWALMGLVVMVLLAMAALITSKRPVAILTIDAGTLATPMIELPWTSVCEVFVTKYFGVVPVLCISTADDKSLMAKGPFPFSIRYPLNQRIVGAPITIPAVRETTLQDLAALIDHYRSTATAET